MSDLIYLAVIAGFFAVAYGLLRACERIIGPDPVVDAGRDLPPTSTRPRPLDADTDADADAGPVEATA